MSFAKNVAARLAVGAMVSTAFLAGPALAEGKTFGLIVNNMAFPYNVVLAEGFIKSVEAGGDKAVVLDSKMSMETQANQIDDLMAQGVNGIAFMANDSVAVMALVDKVAEAGLPIVAAAVPVGDPNENPVDYAYPNLNALVSTQDVIAGHVAGVYAASVLPKDREVKIAVVEGAPGFAVVTRRQQGFEAALKEGGITCKIVSSQPSDWTPDSGEQICQNALTANPDLDAIFSHAEDMALGCAKAIADAGSSARLIATGGGSALGAVAIQNGEIEASVCTQPGLIGELAGKVLQEAAVDPAAAKKGRHVTYDMVARPRTTSTSAPSGKPGLTANA